LQELKIQLQLLPRAVSLLLIDFSVMIDRNVVHVIPFAVVVNHITLKESDAS
jgi:hypothetical protein